VESDFTSLEFDADAVFNDFQVCRMMRAKKRIMADNYSWKAKPNIPAPIVGALKRMKDCGVQIESRADDPEEYYNCRVTFESILSRKGLMGLDSIAHNLRVLEVIIPVPGNTPLGGDTLNLLGQIVLKTSLKTLGIHAAGRIYPWSPFRDGPTKNAFGTIREFGWLFNHTDFAQKQLNLQGLRLTNFCLCRADENNIRSMRDFVRWKALRRAHFTCPVFVQIAAEQNVQLHSFSLHLENPDDWVRSCIVEPDIGRLRDFLGTQRNLRTLEICNGSQVFTPLDTDENTSFLESLGNSLYSLVVHHNEPRSTVPSKVRPLLSRTVLRHVGKQFRHLRRLAIDLPPEDVMVYEITLAFICTSLTSCRCSSILPQSRSLSHSYTNLN